jgi:hypothetical protein
MCDPTLTEALRLAGYGHRAHTNGRQEVFELKTGKVIGAMRAREAWAWLRAAK